MKPIMGTFSGSFIFICNYFSVSFKIYILHSILAVFKHIMAIMIFTHLWLVSRPLNFLCSISDSLLRLLGIFPHTLEDTALIVRSVMN